MKKGKLVALNNRSANEWVETNVSCKNVFLRKKKKRIIMFLILYLGTTGNGVEIKLLLNLSPVRWLYSLSYICKTSMLSFFPVSNIVIYQFLTKHCVSSNLTHGYLDHN